MPKTYCEAINEILHELMSEDDRIVIVGSCCLNSAWYVGGTLTGLKEKFPDRIIDGPVSENGVTGMAVGMAISGMRPIVVFPRMDFMLYAIDPIINQAAKWHFMLGGRTKVPIVFWSIINNGGSQGAQHSQDFMWIFEGIPGLKVVRPVTPLDAMTLMIGAINDDSPVVYVDNRKHYNQQSDYVLDGLVGQNIDSWVEQNRTMVFMKPECPMPASQALEVLWFKRYGR